MYKSILVPIDLAEPEIAEPALKKAAALAGQDGALRLISVRSLVPIGFMEFVPADFDANQQVDNETQLAAIAASVDLPEERVSAVVRLGAVYAEILAEAEGWPADLIVIGSHRPAMASYLLGSNASTIVRHAKCSVLVVRPG